MDKETRLRPKKPSKRSPDPSEEFNEEDDSKKMYMCPYKGCGKQFSESGNLKTHIRIHTGERPFVCDFPGCNKSFITKGHLKSHVLTHTGEKPHVCSYCGKKYSRIGRLTIHVRTHTGEKPFICPYHGCDKSFTEKGNLKTHLRIHTGEKPYKCEYPGCDKRFTTQGHLKDHIRRHNNERPFKCEECGASFLRASTLKIHYRRHTGERPYKCPYESCGKAFSESGNLKTHMKIHERNKKRRGRGRKIQAHNGNPPKVVPPEPVSSKEIVEEPIKEVVEEQKELGATSSGVALPPTTMHQTAGTENIGFEKLPLGDSDLLKDGVGRSPLGSFFQSQLMSPLSLGGSKFIYGSPQAQGAMKFPFTGAGASNCNQILGSPLNCPPTFGAYIDFSSFSNVTPCNRAGNLNLPNSIFGSGNCSPCFPAFSAGAHGVDSLCKSDDKDN